jgi:hypothetical protein
VTRERVSAVVAGMVWFEGKLMVSVDFVDRPGSSRVSRQHLKLTKEA